MGGFNPHGSIFVCIPKLAKEALQEAVDEYSTQADNIKRELDGISSLIKTGITITISERENYQELFTKSNKMFETSAYLEGLMDEINEFPECIVEL